MASNLAQRMSAHLKACQTVGQPAVVRLELATGPIRVELVGVGDDYVEVCIHDRAEPRQSDVPLTSIIRAEYLQSGSPVRP